MQRAEQRAGVKAKIRSATARWRAGATLEQIRADLEALLAGPCPGDRQDTRIANLPATLTTPENATKDALILYCHGGGFQIGSPRSHASLIARLAQASGVAVLAPDYRLAPEHRFPAAHEDCFAVYQALLAQRQAPQRLVVAGDSAGGNLALGVALRARAASLPLPAGIALISPHLDPMLRGESYITRKNKDIFSTPEAISAMARTYLGRGANPADPLANPLNAELAGLPPILIHAGDFDVTLDDSTLLAARAKAQGATLDLKIWPEMFHHFQAFDELEEARTSLDEIGVFIARCVA